MLYTRMYVCMYACTICYSHIYMTCIYMILKSHIDVYEDRPLFAQFCGDDPQTVLAESWLGNT